MALVTRERAEASFRKVEQVLDTALAILRTGMYEYNFLDFSNRTGFEKSGFPYYLWEVHLQRDSLPYPMISREEVCISYVEPMEEDEEKRIQISAIAEQFLIGKASHFKRRLDHYVRVEEAAASRICEVATVATIEAQEMIKEAQGKQTDGQ